MHICPNGLMWEFLGCVLVGSPYKFDNIFHVYLMTGLKKYAKKKITMASWDNPIYPWSDPDGLIFLGGKWWLFIVIQLCLKVLRLISHLKGLKTNICLLSGQCIFGGPDGRNDFRCPKFPKYRGCAAYAPKFVALFCHHTVFFGEVQGSLSAYDFIYDASQRVGIIFE